MLESVRSDITPAQPEIEKKKSLLRRIFSPKVLTYVALTNAAIVGVLSTEKEQPAVNQSMTNADLLDVIKSEMGDLKFRKLKITKFDEMETVTDPGIAFLPMLRKLIDKLQSEGEALYDDPEEGAAKIQNAMTSSVDYLSTYRMSVESAQCCDAEELDCNDYANMTCEKLSKHGIPMHLLSIWPKNPDDRLSHDWHQLAVCRIGEEEFLIFDNSRTLFHWKGTLDEFADHYHEVCKHPIRMEVIPYVGKSAYAPARIDCAASQIVLQIEHLTSEDDMQTLNLVSQYRALAQLDTGELQSNR